jgi:glycosyltransferase involved in cell wall biosynthesis
MFEHRMNEMKNYSLTVVTPAKGECKGLVDTARSILEQSIPVEWIIIKSANHEVTNSALENLPNDPRIQVIVEEGSGIYSAMNQGLLMANGKFVTFFGVGDYWLSKNAALHMTTKLRKERKEWGLGSWFFLDQDNSLICPPTDISINKEHVFLTSTPLCHQTVVATKQILCKTGGFDTTLVVAADRLSIKNLWDLSEPVVWDFPTVVYKAGGFSSLNEELARRELGLLHDLSLDSRSRVSAFVKNFNALVASGRRYFTFRREYHGPKLQPFDWLPESVKKNL